MHIFYKCFSHLIELKIGAKEFIKMVTIGILKKEDVVHVLHQVEFLLTELHGKPYTVDTSVVLPVIEEALDNGRYIALAAIEGKNKIVGILTLGEAVAVYADGRFGIIHELYVSPKFRSKGIGKYLIEKAKDVCRKRAWKRLEVGTPQYPEWSRTKDFYLRDGFIETGPRLRWMS